MAGNKHLVVDFGAVVLCAADEVVALHTVDNTAVGVANLGLVFLERYLFLHGHKFADTALLFLVGHWVAEGFGRSSLLG